MGKFSEFNDLVNLKDLQKNAEEIKKNGGTGDFPTVPDGKYIAKCERLEIGQTQDGRPMMKTMFRLIRALEDVDNDNAVIFMRGKKYKPCVFMNRVLFGTKNDANMIASALGWLDSLEPTDEVGPVVFKDYDQFDELVMDIADDVSDVEYVISYVESAFNSIHIEEIYE